LDTIEARVLEPKTGRVRGTGSELVYRSNRGGGGGREKKKGAKDPPDNPMIKGRFVSINSAAVTEEKEQTSQIGGGGTRQGWLRSATSSE